MYNVDAFYVMFCLLPVDKLLVRMLFSMLPREQFSDFAGQLAVVNLLLPADFPGSLAADESVEQQQEGGGS